MSKLLPKLSGDWLQCRQTVALMAVFAAGGYTARFVGGVVRNALLGEPVNDLDMATDARPEKVMELAQKAGFKAIGTGLNHGTVTVVVEGRVYEITTLRIDVKTHGRHATVAFTKDWVEDAARRDFTMNALYAGADGTVFDPLGGYEDLQARRVRFIGSPRDRITEDNLRILRFFRFSAQYGQGNVDEEGLAACVHLQKGLGTLSAERIRSEFMRLLLMPRAVDVVEIMYSHGLLLQLACRVPHFARFKNWLTLENHLVRDASAIDRLGALFMLVTEDAAFLARKLRLSNQEKKALGRWARAFDINENLDEAQARVLFYRLGEEYQTRIIIQWLLSGAGVDHPAWRHIHDLPERWHVPAFPVQGQDLLEHGMTPGPSVGKTLLKLERRWIESDFQLQRAELLRLFSAKP